jgi:hypothetical protein
MKYTWWILLTIAGILSLTSVYGFILCLGSFDLKTEIPLINQAINVNKLALITAPIIYKMPLALLFTNNFFINC